MSFTNTVIGVHWNHVAAHFGVQDSDAWADFLQYSITQYNDPARKYHNLQHPIQMLREFERIRGLIRRPESFVLKVIGHDLIYDPRSKQNELNSAAVICSCMEAVGFPQDVVNDVHAGIWSTHGHYSSDPDDQYLITLDLARLGESPHNFRLYSKALEEEYVPHFGIERYNAGRLEWAESFLTRKPIFPTPYGHRKYEAQTIKNLRHLIDGLKQHVA